jgi:hypothetical protein
VCEQMVQTTKKRLSTENSHAMVAIPVRQCYSIKKVMVLVTCPSAQISSVASVRDLDSKSPSSELCSDP